MAFQALWGVPYISNVYAVSPTSAAAAITMIAAGYVINAPLVGRLADVLAARGIDAFTARRNILLGTAVCYFLTWVPIALAPGFLSFNAMYVVLFIMGAAASSAGLVYSMAKDLFPPGVSGFATGLVNVMSIMGGAVMPPLVGWFIRLFAARGIEGGVLYSRALIPCFVVAVLGFATLSIVRKPVAKLPIAGQEEYSSEPSGDSSTEGTSKQKISN
jgi:nitrate/nitrite transporter NarK